MSILADEHIGGRIKAGAIVGTPLVFTVSFPVRNTMAAEVLFGYDYMYYFLDQKENEAGGIYIGTGYMFTVANVNFKFGLTELSLGPRFGVSMGFINTLSFDFLIMLRWEYSFTDLPLNIYLEAGPGLRLKLIEDKNAVPLANGSGGIGLRYFY